MKTKVEQLRDHVYNMAKELHLNHVDRTRAIHLALQKLDAETLEVIQAKAAAGGQ